MSANLRRSTLLNQGYLTGRILFNPRADGKIYDHSLNALLNDRIDLIAFDAFEEEWNKKAEEYRNILSQWQFFTCSKISLTYRSPDGAFSLETAAYKVFEFKNLTPKEMCYVKSWQDRKTFGDLVIKIREIFGFKQKKDELMDFFDDRVEVIQRLIDKGLDVPLEWKSEVRPRRQETPKPVDSINTQNESAPHRNPSKSKDEFAYSNEDESTIEYSSESEGLSPKERKWQAEENLDAADDWLKSNGYDCSNAIREYDRLNKVRRLVDNHIFSVIVNGAKRGKLFMRPANWISLAEPDVFMLIASGKGMNPICSQQDLLDKYTRTLMRVRNRAISPEHLQVIAEMNLGTESFQFILYDAEAKFDAEFEREFSSGSNKSTVNTGSLNFADDSFLD